MFRRSSVAAFAMFPLLQAGVAAADGDTISGTARVIDADVIIVAEQRVMLWGLDAPERPQTCSINGRLWGCRDASLRTLETLAGRGEVSCRLVGKPDVFGRSFGVCESGGQDINSEMVRQGMALAYVRQTDEYVDDQLEAIAAQVGLWQPGVEFVEPWVYRETE